MGFFTETNVNNVKNSFTNKNNYTPAAMASLSRIRGDDEAAG